ncbi:MAG: hypothetical protein PHI73_00095 [Patescibacteria group bacterium]|nr:hypothetical protein [Patescibacteria group bacterium]
MTWVKEFSRSASNLLKGQVLEGFQPLDFYHFFPLWYDLWIARISQAITKLDLESRHFNEIREILPPPSNMRAILMKLISSYHASHAENKEYYLKDYKLVANFFARLLKESCPDDPFALKSNPFQTKSEIDGLIKNIKWNKADIQYARKIGRLITAVGSFVHGLYNDLVTDLGWDAYGPYHLESKQIFLIRHFPNLRPKELWPKRYLASAKEIIIYTVYSGVELEISFVGCHTISHGLSPVEGMKKFAVSADKKPLDAITIDNLIDEFSFKATEIYKEIRQLDFEDLKSLVMKQECYQLKMLFDQAGIDWRPTDEMISRIKNKPLLRNIFPHGKLIKTTTEFEKIFGICEFEKSVLE